MYDTISLLRAVAAVFVRRVLTRTLVLAGGLLAIVFGGVVYLGTQVNPAWWLGLVVLVPLFILLLGVGLGVRLVAGLLSPRKLTPPEMRSVRDFTDKLFETAETVRTPLPMLGLRLMKDLVLHRDPRLVKELIASSSSLRSEYQQLKQTFRV
jgi:hypothetical protein